ncbi:hypothetical protein QAD02_000515 [Eretmocerus hayati]|uniref:Uncharacterized protein n=1 Tax=Eretmocerus hayati TaxID=131215 RepID=A0ACC2NED2_9HYME|nr:hypothetical protein QAD02_000515 [Eretmocerus hayati]
MRGHSTPPVRLSECKRETGPSISSVTMDPLPDMPFHNSVGVSCASIGECHTTSSDNNHDDAQFTSLGFQSLSDPRREDLPQQPIPEGTCTVVSVLHGESNEVPRLPVKRRVRPTTSTHELSLIEMECKQRKRTNAGTNDNESASYTNGPLAATIRVLTVELVQFSRDQLLTRKDNFVHFIALDFIATTAICKQLVDMELLDLGKLKTQKVELGSIIQTTTPSEKHIFTIFSKEIHDELPSSARFIFYMGKLKKLLLEQKIESVRLAKNGNGLEKLDWRMAAELKIKPEVEPVTPPTSPSSEDSIPLVNKVDDRPIEEYEKGIIPRIPWKSGVQGF